MIASDALRFGLLLALDYGHRVVVVVPGWSAVPSALAELESMCSELDVPVRVVRAHGSERLERGGVLPGHVRLVADVRQIRGMVADEVFVPADTLPATFIDIVPALAPGGDMVTYELERAGV